MKRVVHTVGVALLGLAGCTDPVEEARAPRGSEAAPAAARTAASEDDQSAAEAERARERRAALAASAETVPAEVAAGLEDGGVELPAPEPALAAADADGTAIEADGGGSEPSEYIRPVIHANVIENFEILRFALAEDVVEREPVMISSRFRHDSGPMHVFLEVRNQTAEDVTLLVGFRRASVEQRGGGVSLTVPPSPRYRTRARGNTRRAPGEWVCEVMDERQRVLVTQRFFIVPDTNAETAAPAASAPATP